MNLIKLLLQASWHRVAIAVIAGGLSGGSTVGLIALINMALSQTQSPSHLVFGGFALLCLIQLSTRFISEVSLTWLAQGVTCHLQMLLGQRMLTSSLRQLEGIGTPALLASLTEDIGAVSNAVTMIPFVCIDTAIVIGCLIYLGWLSAILFLILLVFLSLGVVSIQMLQSKAIAELSLARNQQDQLFLHFRTLTEGIKELKLHSDRRQAFLSEDLQLTALSAKNYKIAGMTIYIGANSWGEGLQFIVVGGLLFLLPNLQPISPSVLSGYILTIIYLANYVGQTLGVLPSLGRAKVALQKIDDLGLLLERNAEPKTFSRSQSNSSWQRLDLLGVIHTYRSDRDDSHFTLGPIDLTLTAGELVFIVGGNGSGKSTLAKLLTGLYLPESGEIWLDDQPVNDDNREWYRQHFSVVFSDFYLFDRFLGLNQIGDRVQEYLVKLQLDHKVTVEAGRLSTTNLSQGQRKRLALLTAYLEDRPIYLFDEWASDQDPIFKQTFYEQLLPELKANGKTVLVISHDERYFSKADRIIKLDYGQVVDDQFGLARKGDCAVILS